MTKLEFPNDTTPKEKKFIKKVVLENMRRSVEHDKQTVRDFESTIRRHQEIIADVVERIRQNSMEIARIEMVNTD